MLPGTQQPLLVFPLTNKSLSGYSGLLIIKHLDLCDTSSFMHLAELDSYQSSPFTLSVQENMKAFTLKKCLKSFTQDKGPLYSHCSVHTHTHIPTIIPLTHRTVFFRVCLYIVTQLRKASAETERILRSTGWRGGVRVGTKIMRQKR